MKHLLYTSLLVSGLLLGSPVLSIELSQETFKAVDECRSLALDPWDSRSSNRNIRVSNIKYQEAIETCSKASSQVSFEEQPLLDDVRHWLARSLIARGFQTDRKFDLKGLKIEQDLTEKGHCAAAVGLLSVVRYFTVLPAKESKRISSGLDIKSLNQSLNIASVKLKDCPKFFNMLDQYRFLTPILYQNETDDQKIELMKNFIVAAKKSQEPDSMYWAAYSFRSLKGNVREIVGPYLRVIEELLSEAASNGHVNSMLLYHDIFGQSKSKELERNGIMWLKKAVSLNSEGAFIQCALSGAKLKNELRDGCIRKISNSSVKSKAAELVPIFKRLSETDKSLGLSGVDVTRAQLIAAHTDRAILEMFAPILEW